MGLVTGLLQLVTKSPLVGPRAPPLNGCTYYRNL